MVMSVGINFDRNWWIFLISFYFLRKKCLKEVVAVKKVDVGWTM